MMTRKQGVQPDDRTIGLNVRRIRHRAGWSQEKLANALGLTFQQVQKYEKGTNRIGGSRVAQIAGAFGCSIAELFHGVDTNALVPTTTTEPDPCINLGASALGVRMARAFIAIPPKTQQAVVALMEMWLEGRPKNESSR